MVPWTLGALASATPTVLVWEGFAINLRASVYQTEAVRGVFSLLLWPRIPG